MEYHLTPHHKMKALINIRLIRFVYESWLQQKLSNKVIEVTVFLEKLRKSKSQVNFVFYLFIYYYYYDNDERNDFELNNP